MFYIPLVQDVVPDNDFSKLETLNSLINTCTFSGVTITVSSTHGLSTNNLVRFSTGGTLPSPLDVNIQYYVISAGLTTTELEISTTLGGSAINFTGGSGIHSIYKSTLSIATSISHGARTTALAVEGDSTFESWGVVGA